MIDKKSEWEPLPDSRPTLPYILFAVVVAAAITLAAGIMLNRFLLE